MEMVAVCHHTGQSVASGHFLTTLVDPHSENKWEYNDPSVSKTSALDPWSAYIFFLQEGKEAIDPFWNFNKAKSSMQ